MKLIIKTLFFLGCIIFFNNNLIAQNIKIDSLKVLLENHNKNDIQKVNLLIDLAKEHGGTYFDKAIEYLDASESLAIIIDYKLGEARSLFKRGFYIMRKTAYSDGDQYLKKALTLFKEIDSPIHIIECYINLRVFYANNGEYTKAIPYYLAAIKLKQETGNENIANDLFFLGRAYARISNFKEGIISFTKALEIYKEKNNFKKVAISLNAIGNIYSHQGNYPLALEYINKSMEVSTTNKLTKNISDGYMSIGNVYTRLGNYDKAIEHHKKALLAVKDSDYNKATIFHNLGESYKYKKEYDKALDYFFKSLKRFEENNYNKLEIGITLNKIGEIFLALNDITKAKDYFEKAKKLNETLDNKRGLCGSLLGLAKVLFDQKKYNKSKKNILKCNQLSKDLELLDIQRDAQELLSKIYNKTRAFKKSLESHQQFKKLNDSLFNKQNIEKITELEYEYKYKQALDSASIRELKLTQRVSITNKNLEKTQRNYFVAIIVILLVSLIFGGIILFLKLRNAEEKNQKILIEQKLLRSQMTPHFIFNSLSVLQGMILNKESDNAVTYLSEFSKLMRTILENSSQKVVLLADELSAIKSYMLLQNLDTNPPYQFHLNIASTINTSALKIPPMLIQPFIENAIEHAFIYTKENKEIEVTLTFKEGRLVCLIKDNGVGVGDNQKKTSLATFITSERLKILSKEFESEGSILIENRNKFKEQGTLVTLVIPYKEKTISYS